MGPRYRFLVTPLRRSPSPPSHILLVLAHVSSCCLQFLNPFRSCQRFLAAEVAAGPAGQAGPGEAPKAPGNLGWGSKQECPCLPRNGQSLALLQLLPVSCHHLLHPLTVGCVGPQGLWLCISWCIASARRSPTHPSCCLKPQQPGQKAEVGVSWMLIPLLSRALSPCTEQWLCGDVCESRAEAAESAAPAGLCQ